MKGTFSFIKDGGWMTMTLAVIFGVFAVVGIVQAATTINTAITTAGNITTSAGNITATAGTLTIGSTSVLTGGVTAGSSGTALTKKTASTCDGPSPARATVAATTSAAFFCAVTGAASGDKVFVSLPAGAGINPSGAGTPWGGFVVGSAYATTTDYIGFNIMNLTGIATSSFTQATTSVQYWIVD